MNKNRNAVSRMKRVVKGIYWENVNCGLWPDIGWTYFNYNSKSI